jgi:ribosome biogenesis GTPase
VEPPDQLAAYGWNDQIAERFAAAAPPGAVAGRVTRVHRINCDVVTAEGERVARPGPDLLETTGSSLPAAGDWVVLVDPDDGDDELQVETVVPRWSAISRRDPADRATEQILAADVDLVLVIHGLDRELNLRRIERTLVLAHASGAEPVVVLTKSDTVDDPAPVMAEVTGVALDAEVLVTSAVTGDGIDALRSLARPNRTLALLGASGAGKSTLINTLVGESIQDTGDVREGDAKGRHTTTQRELIALPGGGVLVDTPGLRGLGLWDAEEGVALAFADIDDLAEQCKFRDCAHESEPSCAVTEAIASGALDPRRLESYRRLVGEMDDLARRQEEQDRKQKRGRPKPGRKPSGRQADRERTSESEREW